MVSSFRARARKRVEPAARVRSPAGRYAPRHLATLLTPSSVADSIGLPVAWQRTPHRVPIIPHELERRGHPRPYRGELLLLRRQPAADPSAELGALRRLKAADRLVFAPADVDRGVPIGRDRRLARAGHDTLLVRGDRHGVARQPERPPGRAGARTAGNPDEDHAALRLDLRPVSVGRPRRKMNEEGMSRPTAHARTGRLDRQKTRKGQCSERTGPHRRIEPPAVAGGK